MKPEIREGSPRRGNTPELGLVYIRNSSSGFHAKHTHFLEPTQRQHSVYRLINNYCTLTTLNFEPRKLYQISAMTVWTLDTWKK